MHKILTHIKNEWTTLNTFELFIACSGGLDSMVLLHSLNTLGYSVHAIHVNYQLRGEDSEMDAAFVEDFCEENRISYRLQIVDMKKSLEDGGNLQEEARNFRYAWFRKILEEDPKHRILIGQHADDQVETFFLNLSRKSGIMGLSCMPAERDRMIRPLLPFKKEELKAYAKEMNLSWREDVSNKKNNYRRNVLRNVLIPEVTKEVPSLHESILTLVNAFQETQKELEKTISKHINGIIDTLAIPITLINNLNNVEIAELLRQLNLSPKLSKPLIDLSKNQKGKRLPIQHPHFLAISKDTNQLTFILKAEHRAKLIIEKVGKIPKTFSKDGIYLDADKLNGELHLRSWEINDRIYPIGMKGSQLLSDIIRRSKIDANQKASLMVLCDDKNIHWCPGLKIGRLAIADETSSEILKCTIDL
ncbi:MAG: tRNA lysidine(34) synthetase TilS [Crocinitomicaceae bacterium]|nr:tRNA lysidine(34) synthetase TilS [Crocinitomicaceae bacterium]